MMCLQSAGRQVGLGSLASGSLGGPLGLVSWAVGASLDLDLLAIELLDSLAHNAHLNLLRDGVSVTIPHPAAAQASDGDHQANEGGHHTGSAQADDHYPVVLRAEGSPAGLSVIPVTLELGDQGWTVVT